MEVEDSAVGLREGDRERLRDGAGAGASSLKKEVALGVPLLMSGGRDGFVLVKGEKLPGARVWERACCMICVFLSAGNPSRCKREQGSLAVSAVSYIPSLC